MPNILAEIITIGDELLYGQTIDTNSAWIGTKMSDLGVQMTQISTIADKADEIKRTLNEAIQSANIIFITGGLGPTNDDLTKKTLADFFGVKLVKDDSVIKDLKELFSDKGRDLTDNNLVQAYLPENCIKVRNKKGTAPGMWFDYNGKVIVSMPGVPREMKAMMEEEIIPKIGKKFKLPVISHRIIHTVGVPESILASKLEKFEKELPEEISLAYLPSLGMVKLRITAKGTDTDRLNKILDEQQEKLKEVAGKYIFGYDDTDLQTEVGKLLTEKGLTIATAESCSGGKLANTITTVPGSSNYFNASIIAYSYEAKVKLLGVSMDMLNELGAVSEECAIQMAKGVKERLEANIGISSTGIAGPGGGTKEKPVGTVWIAITDGKETISKLLTLGNNDRLTNIELTTVACLNLIRKFLSPTPKS